MARADLLLDLVRAGARGDQPLFRKSLEALVSEERAKQHHVLADRLAAHLNAGGPPNASASPSLTRRNGPVAGSFHEMYPERRMGDLVLPASVANAGRELVEEFRRADLLRAHNLEPRHRVLLTGPPGNGKTSLAEAFATELAVPLFAVRYESVIASYLGETAVRLSRPLRRGAHPPMRALLRRVRRGWKGTRRRSRNRRDQAGRQLAPAADRRFAEPRRRRHGDEPPRIAGQSSLAPVPASAESSGAHPLVGGGVVLSFRKTPWRKPGVQARDLGEASHGPELLGAGTVRSRRTAAVRTHAPRP